MERCKTAFSYNKSAEAMKEEIIGIISRNEDGLVPQVVIITADIDNFEWLAAEIHREFPDATLIGASSYYIYCGNKYGTNGAVVIAIYGGVDVSAGVIFDIDKNPMKHKKVIEDALLKFDNYKDMMCLEFVNGFTMGEELVMDTFRLTLEKKSIPIMGGSAATCDGSTKTLITLNGEIYENSCVFIFIKNTKGRIHIVSENIFEETAHSFTSTDVDCDDRTVYELDYRPAAEVLADCLSIPVVTLPKFLQIHPLGRSDGNKVRLVDYRSVMENGEVSFYARIYNYTKLTLMKIGNPTKTWEDTEKRIKSVVGKPSFSIVINCISRAKYFEDIGIHQDYTNKLSDAYGTYLGLSTYGEQFEFEHTNQTMLIAVFE